MTCDGDKRVGHDINFFSFLFYYSRIYCGIVFTICNSQVSRELVSPVCRISFSTVAIVSMFAHTVEEIEKKRMAFPFT